MEPAKPMDLQHMETGWSPTAEDPNNQQLEDSPPADRPSVDDVDTHPASPSLSAPQHATSASQPSSNRSSHTQLGMEELWGQINRAQPPAQMPPSPTAAGPSAASGMWTQKSIATTARHDLAKMAAIANLSKGPMSPWAASGGSPFGTFHDGSIIADALSGPLGSAPQPSLRASASVPVPLASLQQSQEVLGLEQLLGPDALQGLNLTEEQKVGLARRLMATQVHALQGVPAQPSTPTGQLQSMGLVMSQSLNMPLSSHQPPKVSAASSVPMPPTPIKAFDPTSPLGAIRRTGSPLHGIHDERAPATLPSVPLPPANAAALAAFASEHNLDQSTLLQLLHNSKFLDMLNNPNVQQSAMRVPPPPPRPPSNRTREPNDWPPPQQVPLPQGPVNPRSAAEPNMQSVLNSTLLQEFTQARTALVNLMLQTYAFLSSNSILEFFDKLTPIVMLYDDMHDLPVVQKRKKCQDMSFIRNQLLKDNSFVQVLQAICALRHHLYSLSRKVLVMNQGPDGVPIDLLLGSMSSELYHLLKNMLPQEVSDFFGNSLPQSRLAVLVFSEFTTVDPMPTA